MAERIPARKGLASNRPDRQGNRQRAAMNLDWYYGWGASPKPGASYRNFIPMVWGKNDVDKRLAIIKRQLPLTKTTHLLGFNEPDLNGQAEMTPDQALEFWPKLEKTGLRLGAPATVSPNSAWLAEFMAKADQQNRRVDFMPLHIYGWPDSASFLNKLEDTYISYGRPVWVTEYAVADFDADTKAENEYSPEEVERFMRKTVAGMRKMPYVERFAWKTREINDAKMWPSSLYHLDGTLTSRGRLYASL